MSVTHIPEPVKFRLWGKAAGCCQYRGCPELLYRDPLTQAEFNTAYIAHIIADSPDGPRGHPIESDRLKADITNLMLMCDVHHRLIDKHDVEGHPPELLRQMKRDHETRIELLAAIKEECRSFVLTYGANIGAHAPIVSYPQVSPALVPQWYPAEPRAIGLTVGNNWLSDIKPEFWAYERDSLRHQFTTSVCPRVKTGELTHLSVFGFAPQPLLMYLGFLLSDIRAAEVYQLHREPQTWCWQPPTPGFHYHVIEPGKITPTVALNLSLSATIDDSRITEVMGPETSIWTLTIDKPYNDFLKSREQLALLREEIRQLFNRIKATHGQHTVLHVFPAVPVSAAIEFGRVIMPKAEMTFEVYDQNKKNHNQGFSRVFSISSRQESAQGVANV